MTVTAREGWFEEGEEAPDVADARNDDVSVAEVLLDGLGLERFGRGVRRCRRRGN